MNKSILAFSILALLASGCMSLSPAARSNDVVQVRIVGGSGEHGAMTVDMQELTFAIGSGQSGLGDVAEMALVGAHTGDRRDVEVSAVALNLTYRQSLTEEFPLKGQSTQYKVGDKVTKDGEPVEVIGVEDRTVDGVYVTVLTLRRDVQEDNQTIMDGLSQVITVEGDEVVVRTVGTVGLTGEVATGTTPIVLHIIAGDDNALYVKQNVPVIQETATITLTLEVLHISGGHGDGPLVPTGSPVFTPGESSEPVAATPSEPMHH